MWSKLERFLILRYNAGPLPAVVGGNDHCIAHACSSQGVPELMEESMEQRLQGQNDQESAHKQTVFGLLSKFTRVT